MPIHNNLQDALFPPLEEDDAPSGSEQHMLSLLHSIQSGNNTQPEEDAVTAAVLIQQEIDRWKKAIQELERRCVDNDDKHNDATGTQPSGGANIVLDEDDDIPAQVLVVDNGEEELEEKDTTTASRADASNR